MLRESYYVARADFVARLRDRRLLAVFAASIYLGHMATVGQVQLVFDDRYQGVYNAAWIGTIMSFAASGAIGLFGFYFVKNALERDRNGGPKDVVSSSPLSNISYMFGKWLSNVAVLASVTGVMALTVVVLFLFRGTGPLNLWKLLSPFVLFTLPVAALVGAVALFFESTSFLRGSFGNVSYFFLLVTVPIVAPFDPLGSTFVMESMESALTANYPAYDGGYTFGYVENTGELQTFRWSGLELTPTILRHRLQFLAVSFLVVIGATLPFDRFEPAVGGRFSLPSLSWSPSLPRLGATDDPPATDAKSATTLGSLDAVSASVRPVRLVVAELRLAFRGRSQLWYLGGVGLILASVIAGLETARGTVLVVAWVWPMFVWSEMGARERRHRTESIVFSSSFPLAQLASVWFAGVIAALLFASPVALRLAVAGEVTASGSVLLGALFVPSLALAAGVLSGTPRLFEVGYLVLWYLGPANSTAGVDYGGVTNQPLPTVVGYGLATIVLVGIAVVVRRRRLQ